MLWAGDQAQLGLNSLGNLFEPKKFLFQHHKYCRVKEMLIPIMGSGKKKILSEIKWQKKSFNSTI